MKLMEDRKYLRTLAWWGVVALIAILLVIRAKTQAPTPQTDAYKPLENYEIGRASCRERV